MPVVHYPLVREVAADLETPTSVFLKLGGQGPAFLLESVEGGERVARYSFIGVNPSQQYRLRGGQIERRGPGGVETLPAPPGRDALHVLEAELRQYQSAHVDGLPRFVGGLVGCLGYETIRQFEPRLQPLPVLPDLPQGLFLLADTLVAFDHARRSLFLIAHAFGGDAPAAEARLDALEARLAAPLPQPVPAEAPLAAPVRSNLRPDEYETLVRAAREHIAAGDIFQVVLSQRLSRETSARPFDIYRALRRLNPSPYMFFFDFGEVDGEPLKEGAYNRVPPPEMDTKAKILADGEGVQRRGRGRHQHAALTEAIIESDGARLRHDKARRGAAEETPNAAEALGARNEDRSAGG